MDDDRPPLRVGGMQLLTTVDWPGKLAAILFLQGCPWRCHYCHNHELTPLTAPGMTPWPQVLDELRRRQGFLDAVVFSGGEPTMQSALPDALAEVAELGFQVALHTNGFDPPALERVLAGGNVHYVAMDVKAPFERYEDITTIPASGRGPQESVDVVIASGVPHEFRTTYHPALLTPAELRDIAVGLSERGAQAYFIQKFRREGCPSAGLRNSALLPAEVPDELQEELAGMFWRFGVREP
ncbi:MAG: anaerobic ribonucleoside-triphosphate reductase activating protein [Armatimonadetes bacterium]|nr:anaerobic ribonucleoside-triphosphate reductase activating protein [Armatimonadota bacterium]